MLSIEKIKNIIKSKYNELLEHKNIADTFKNFEFDIQRDEEFDYKIWKEITLFFDEKEKLYYEEKSKHDGDYFYTIKKFEIENNSIELKHRLNIEITSQDIIDWLNTILKINEDGEYSIPTPPSFSQVLVEILDDKTIEIKTSLIFKDKKEREEHLILLANNSNDYWKLYNIIKNLKE